MRTEPDRRVRRSRDLLHRSLIALILEKGYRQITVQDILDRADVGRSTFYAHYRGKDDLLLASAEEHLRTIFAERESTALDDGKHPEPMFRPALTLFRLVDQNRSLYEALVGRRGSDLVVRSTRDMLATMLSERLRTRLAIQDGGQLPVLVAFLVSALMGMLTWWLDTDPPYSADEMYAHFERMATHGIGRRTVARFP